MQLKFSIKSSTHYLGFLRQMVSTLRRPEMGIRIGQQTAASLALAMVEAVNNAIFHAHKRDIHKWIGIVIRVDPNAVTMEVHDSGPGFDMSDFEAPPVDHTHGRGLFIIRSLMHDVKYTRGSKNVLKMAYFVYGV